MSSTAQNTPERCPRYPHRRAPESAPGCCAVHHAIWQAHRGGAVSWARWALATRNVCIVDTETTGLGNDAEVVEITVLSTRGEVLFDSLVRPRCPVPPAATAVHHLDDTAVLDAPRFIDLYGLLTAVLRRRICGGLQRGLRPPHPGPDLCGLPPSLPPSLRLALRHAAVREVHWRVERVEARL